MSADPVERKLAAILSADVVGYSRLMAEDEIETVRTPTAYREVTATLIRHAPSIYDPGGAVAASHSWTISARGGTRVPWATLSASKMSHLPLPSASQARG